MLCPVFWTHLPPLGIATLSSFLSSRGYETDVRDLNIELFHAVPDALKSIWLTPLLPSVSLTLLRHIKENMPEYYNGLVTAAADYSVIGFSLFRSNREYAVGLARDVRERNPAARIVFGGPETLRAVYDSGFRDALFLDSGADILVAGEGESGFEKCLKREPEEPVLVSFEEETDLDSFPFPTFSGFPLRRYKRQRALPIQASRGCIRRCRFCTECLLSTRYKCRSARHVFDEILWHRAHNKTCWFTFHDSLINGDLDMLDELCALLIKDNTGIKWEAQVAIRPDMDEHLLRKMKQAGCFNIFVGLESGSGKVLAKMGKGYTPEAAAAFLRRVRRSGLHAEISLIVGFPEETDDDFEETLSFLSENRSVIPKIAQVNPFVLLPESAYARENAAGSDGFPHVYNGEVSRRRMDRCVGFFEKNDFTYTPYFINNLAYET